jgi:hypothetical protein
MVLYSDLLVNHLDIVSQPLGPLQISLSLLLLTIMLNISVNLLTPLELQMFIVIVYLHPLYYHSPTCDLEASASK